MFMNILFTILIQSVERIRAGEIFDTIVAGTRSISIVIASVPMFNTATCHHVMLIGTHSK